MGDEDEGFDEEFCDSEDPPLRTVPDIPPLSLQELTNSDLQTLLADSSLADSTIPPFPTTTLFDDIDPGVYMLEAENSTHSILDPEPVKSPLHSPFPVSAPSPVCASMSLADSAAAVEEWNINSCQPIFDGVDSQYPPASSGSGYGSPVEMCAPGHYLFPPPSPSSSSSHISATSCNYDVDMLVSMCQSSNHQTAQPASPLPSQFCQQGSMSSITFGDRLSPSPSLPVNSPVTHGPPLLPSTSQYSNHQTRPSVQVQGPSEGTSPNSTPHGTRTDSMSCSTQTSSSSYNLPSHTPSPSYNPPSHTHTPYDLPAHTPLSSYNPPSHPPSTPSCSTPQEDSSDESDIPKRKSFVSDKIVNMPFYQFKKILDSPAIPEEKKNNIKNLRRRGKNKIAAKTCRQRKMDLVLGLQQEIEQLRALKIQIYGRTNSLQREIEALKTRCLLTQRHRQHTC